MGSAVKRTSPGRHTAKHAAIAKRRTGETLPRAVSLRLHLVTYATGETDIMGTPRHSSRMRLPSVIVGRFDTRAEAQAEMDRRIGNL